MKFMIMVFGVEAELQAKPPSWAEEVTAYVARLESELAASGELVFSEVLEDGGGATLVDRHRKEHRGSITGQDYPLSRFWVITVASEERAHEIAGGLAEVVGSAVEVRRVQMGAQRP